MLPFSEIDFYLLFLVVVVALYALKGVLDGRVSLASVLLGISLAYILFYYPKPLQILVFIAYQCLFTWLLLFKWVTKRRSASTSVYMSSSPAFTPAQRFC